MVNDLPLEAIGG